MSHESQTDTGSHVRFPGFDTLSQRRHWDPVTAGVVLARTGVPADIRFFTPGEQALATALCDQLLGQHEETRLPVVTMIDTRLAEGETDGWHYEDMPEDAQAWKLSLAALDADARSGFGRGFADCSCEQQAALIQAVQDRGGAPWHDLPAKRVWSLWTRYACTAFYSHPDAWSEIGFAGPAYPRGYKNIGLDALEPFEVRDHRPDDDPVRDSGRGRRS